jgi:hypothetical protein
MKSMRLLLLVASSALAADPTFYKDVMPILQNRCQECHRAGEAAPMALMTYKQTRPLAKAIEKAVLSKKMPPWHADPHFGKFANDRSLSEAELKTLSSWVKTGAKEGNAKDAPAPREFAAGWTIGKPDVVLEMPMDFKVPASGTVDYTYFLVPTGFTEDKWVEKIEVRPGATSVVHHIVLLSRKPGSKYLKDLKVGEPYVAKGNASSASERKPDNGKGVFFALDGNDFEMVSVYVPGGVAYETKPGQARLIPAGSELIFQMHYTANGKEVLDRSRVGMVFAKAPPKERVVNTFIANLNLAIPPGAENHRVDANVKVHEDVVLQTLFPHMHLRGKAFEYEATYPSGEKEMLLKVPAYDFNWQLTYQLAKPLLLPKGTEIRATAWFDNSPNNKYNPDPKAQVHWGDQSWEEMLAGFVDFVVPLEVNPRSIAYPKKPAPAGPAR